MKADIILIISEERPLTSQLAKILGAECCGLGDFVTIGKNERYTFLKHWESGLTVAYTSEEKLIESYL